MFISSKTFSRMAFDSSILIKSSTICSWWSVPGECKNAYTKARLRNRNNNNDNKDNNNDNATTSQKARCGPGGRG